MKRCLLFTVGLCFFFMPNFILAQKKVKIKDIEKLFNSESYLQCISLGRNFNDVTPNDLWCNYLLAGSYNNFGGNLVAEQNKFIDTHKNPWSTDETIQFQSILTKTVLYYDSAIYFYKICNDLISDNTVSGEETGYLNRLGGVNAFKPQLNKSINEIQSSQTKRRKNLEDNAVVINSKKERENKMIKAKTQFEKLKAVESINCVLIGDKIWMAENLNITTYRNGDEIPQVQDPAKWSNLKTGAWCYYENKTANGVTYGKLYNWYAVNDYRGLAPKGWRIPTQGEWDTLQFYVSDKTGGKLKAETGWQKNGNGTNETGFAAFPGGERGCIGSNGKFFYLEERASWWSSTKYVANGSKDIRDPLRYAWSFCIYNYDNKNSYSILALPKESGFSVRCIKDLKTD